MSKINKKKFSFVKSVLLTSLWSFILAEIFFAALYYSIINLVHLLQVFLIFLLPGSVEANAGIFNPIMVFTFLLGLILVSLVAFIEISTIIAITVYDYFRDDNISLKSIGGFVLREFKKLGNYKIIPVFILILLYPKDHIGAGGLYTLDIPPFILYGITDNNTYFFLFLIIVILLLFVIYKGIFLVHILLLEKNNSIFSAYKKSFQITKNFGFWKIFKASLLAIYFSILLLFGLSVTVDLLEILIKYIFGNYEVLRMFILGGISYVENFLFITIPGIIFLAVLTVRYLQISNFSSQKFDELFSFVEKKKISVKRKSLLLNFIKKFNKKILNFLAILSIFLMICIGSIFLKVSTFHIQNIDIFAHRGDLNGDNFTTFVENTIPAIENAHKNGVDFVEIDFYENKDGSLYLSHDPTLKRVFGIKRNISDMTDEEMDSITLPDGSHIPTLEEVFILAKKKNIKLLIEPKIHGKEKNLAKTLLNLIEKHNMYDLIKVHSLSLSTVLDIEELRSRLDVGYIVFGVVGDLSAIPVDFFSVQETVLSESLINKIHNSDKQVYAWTINSDKKLEKYIFMGVDGFITDEIKLIETGVKTLRESFIKNEQYYFQLFGKKILLPRF